MRLIRQKSIICYHLRSRPSRESPAYPFHGTHRVVRFLLGWANTQARDVPKRKDAWCLIDSIQYLSSTAQAELNGPAEAWALGKPAGPRTTRPRLAYGWSL